MGIDEVIARANEYEEKERGARYEQAIFQARKQLVVDGLYRDLVQRLKRSGVSPQRVFTVRQRHFLMRWLNGEVKTDTGQKAWALYSPEISERLSANPWIAVTEDGTEILAHHETYKGSPALRKIDMAQKTPEFLIHPDKVTAEDLDPATRQRIVDDTSEILAAALMRLGAAQDAVRVQNWPLRLP